LAGFIIGLIFVSVLKKTTIPQQAPALSQDRASL
jgi:hypothetical protein